MTNYCCPECYVEGKDIILNPQNPDVRFCPECGWLIDLQVLETQPFLKVKVKGFWDYRPIHYNPEDGNGYFQDNDNKWCMAPKLVDGNSLSYDWDCISNVEDMASNGVGEEEIARVNEFINSIKERI